MKRLVYFLPGLFSHLVGEPQKSLQIEFDTPEDVLGNDFKTIDQVVGDEVDSLNDPDNPEDNEIQTGPGGYGRPVGGGRPVNGGRPVGGGRPVVGGRPVGGGRPGGPGRPGGSEGPGGAGRPGGERPDYEEEENPEGSHPGGPVRPGGTGRPGGSGRPGGPWRPGGTGRPGGDKRPDYEEHEEENLNEQSGSDLDDTEYDEKNSEEYGSGQTTYGYERPMGGRPGGRPGGYGNRPPWTRPDRPHADYFSQMNPYVNRPVSEISILELILKYGDRKSNQDFVNKIKNKMMEFIFNEEDEKVLKKDMMKMMVLSGKGVSMNFDNNMGSIPDLKSSSGLVNLLNLINDFNRFKEGNGDLTKPSKPTKKKKKNHQYENDDDNIETHDRNEGEPDYTMKEEYGYGMIPQILVPEA